MSKSQKFVMVSLSLLLMASVGFAQKVTQLQVKQGTSAYIKDGKPMFAVIPRANGTEAVAQPDVQVPIWTGTFTFNAQTSPITWSAPTRQPVRRPRTSRW